MNRSITDWILIIGLIYLAGCNPASDTRNTQPVQEAQPKIAAPTPQASRPATVIPTAATPLPAVTEFQPQSMSLSSPLIESGGAIISQFTCSGSGFSPPLQWIRPPEGTMSFALIVEDPDAPSGNFVHWVLFNIPADRRDLPQGVAGDEIVEGIGVQGKNDAGKTGYTGPCPPVGPPHRYFFRLYALDTRLFLPAGSQKSDLEKGMQGHILAQAEFVASFQRMKGESGG